jgi:hypothetical protein
MMDIMKKCNIPHASYHRLEWYSFPNTKNVLDDPKEPEKYNNTEVKNGATYNFCHTALDTCCCNV